MLSLRSLSRALAALPFAAAAHAQATGVPTIAPLAPATVQVGDSVRIPLVVNDLAPGAPVELRLERAPAGAVIRSGAIRWRPLRADAGATWTITVRGTGAGTELAPQTTTVTVANAHRPPVLRQPADRVIAPGDSLVLPLDVDDPDGDAVSIAVTNVTDPALPPRVDARTGTLVWVPPRGPANRLYLWRITAADAEGATSTAELHVAVRSQNVAPSCGPMRTYKRDEGETVDIALDAEDANGDTLRYQPLATLPNGTQTGAVYHWEIPYNFVLPTRQDSTVRFEWRATDPAQATTNGACVALVTVFRSIAEEPFRTRQQEHRQLLTDVRAQLAVLAGRERATRDSVAGIIAKKRLVKRASLVSALVGGLLQIATSEETRRIAAGVSATLTVGLSGWETTIDDGAPIATRAEALAQQHAALQRGLSRFLRKYGETVSREALLGPSYAADHLELFDLLSAAR